MERERLTRLVQEPGRVAREDLAGLKALAEKYPWFSGAQLLYTAGVRSSADVLFDETLRNTSAHLPARSVLFDLATAPPKPAPLQVVKPDPILPASERAAVTVEAEVLPPVPTPAPTEERTEPVAPLPANTERVEPVAASVIPEAITPAPEVISAPEALPAAPPVVVVKQLVPPAPVAKETFTPDPLGAELDHQILRSVMANAYDITQLEPPAKEPPPTSKPPTPLQRTRPSVLERTARLRFSEWLDEAESEPPTALLVTGVEKSIAPPPSETPGLATHELIDRFIRQETPDPKATGAFFKPQLAGKRSLDDTAGLVTETLARIYEKQGNFPKAIATYGKLALKYPEKAAYFAALQKKLEEQQVK